MKLVVGLLNWIIIITYVVYSPVIMAQTPAGNTGGYVLLSGEIISPAGTPIEGVHILNTNTNELSISDESGFFSLTMHKSHVLRLSAVGFRTYYFSLKQAVNEDVVYKRITLQTVTVGLKNVDIVAKEEPRAENLFRPKPLPAPFSFGYQGEQHELKPTISSPLSLLYEWLSKEGKQKRQLEELLKQEEIKKLVEARFESDLIWELTGLAGDELEDFKKHCNFTDDFVTSSSDYEFLLKIKECYNSFQQSNE